MATVSIGKAHRAFPVLWLSHLLLSPWLFKASNTQRVTRNPPLGHRGAAAPLNFLRIGQTQFLCMSHQPGKEEKSFYNMARIFANTFTLTWCHLEIWQETVELAQRHLSGVRPILSRSEHGTLIYMENDGGTQSSLHSSLAGCLLGKLPNTGLFFSFSSLLFKGSPIRSTAQSIPAIHCQECCMEPALGWLRWPPDLRNLRRTRKVCFSPGVYAETQ